MAQFKPIIARETAKLNIASLYDRYAGKAASFGMIPAQDANLNDYVTNKALDGLFSRIADEERAIRKDPMGQTSSIIKKGIQRREVSARAPREPVPSRPAIEGFLPAHAASPRTTQAMPRRKRTIRSFTSPGCAIDARCDAFGDHRARQPRHTLLRHLQRRMRVGKAARARRSAATSAHALISVPTLLNTRGSMRFGRADSAIVTAINRPHPFVVSGIPSGSFVANCRRRLRSSRRIGPLTSIA